MARIFDAGYFYELAGLAFYILFIVMTRRSNAARYSQRTRILTIAAAIALVGSGILHYATVPAGVLLMTLLAAASLVSAALERRRR